LKILLDPQIFLQLIRANNKYSRQQTALGLALLFILMIIGAGIFLTQFDYNPSVLPHESFLPAASKETDASPSPPAESIVQLPPGMVPLSSPENFNTQTLSDKINGKAELYLSAGFVSLASQRFNDKDGSNLWVETYIYNMGDGHNAFSVFSAQRREGAASLDLATNAYRTQNALFLVHGPFYLEIIASEATDNAFKSIRTLAENFIRNTRTKTEAIVEKDLFPAGGMLANSIALISADAFGFDRLDKIYTAEYEIGENSLMAFLSRRQGSLEAQQLASAYQNFLETFGGQNLDTKLPIENAQLVEILETYEVIFSCGPYIAGVREAGNKEAAINLAVKLYEIIKEVVGES
jgi:hypothetical protein